jgi:hypothetical protein
VSRSDLRRMAREALAGSEGLLDHPQVTRSGGTERVWFMVREPAPTHLRCVEVSAEAIAELHAWRFPRLF